ncbi:MAG: hypothetical protein LC799_26505, partial [Actinobacteria bacterium]|nr:hypothetical protein [Actinomycetota bacterium]
LVAPSIPTAVVDPYGMFIGELCRFWLGKRFGPGTGVNVVTPGGRPVLRALAPSQPLEPTSEGNLEGFPFEVRLGGQDPKRPRCPATCVNNASN